MNSSRLQLKYTIQSSGFRKETLTGIEYEVFGIISNYGDTVVHPGNAPGPVLIPKSALISLAELRNGRYVVVNHPTYWGQDVPSTFNKAVIEGHQIGFWFNNYYDGVRNCIRGEIWIDPIRANQVVNGQEILDRLRLGEKVEVSESNVCFSDPTPGELNGQHYDEILLIMVPEHIAVLPEGYVGACSNEGGCGAGVNMSMKVDNQGKGGKPMTISQTAKWIFRDLKSRMMGGAGGDPPQRKNQILANDIWVLLWSALKSAEPAFYELSDFDPDKGLVFYYTRIILGDRYDGQTELTCYMRSYSITNGVVTLGDDVTEVMETRTYEPVSTVNQVNQQAGESESTPPVTTNESETVETTNETINQCSCKGEKTMSAEKANETPVVTPTEVESTNSPVNPPDGGTTPNTPANPANPSTPTAPAVTPATPAVPVNQASPDWINSVPPEYRTVLESLAAQEKAKHEAYVKVAVNQGLPESAARKLSSTELVTVLEKMGIQSQAGRPITAALTNEAGEQRQRPSPWSGAGKAN